jgi:predicted TPR repeat methyltransferase
MVGILDEVQGAVTELLIDRPRVWIGQARERMRDLPKTNFDLGCDFAEQGKWLDAMFRFRMTAYFDADYPQVWYNLGMCYFRLGRLKQAQDALQKAMAQNPGQIETLFLLTAINPSLLPPNHRPTHMPVAMVADVFTPIAASYDVEEARSQYQAGKLVYELMRPLVKVANPAVLDLACGTGIVSRPWREGAREIIGVDSTKAMIELAEKMTHGDKKLFDRVIEVDVAQLPANIAAGSIDLAMLINAAQFVGDLSGVMQGVSRVLQVNGLFVLTVEPHNAQAGFGVNASGRFGHSTTYVHQVARDAGLAFVRETTVAIYPGSAVQAFIFSKGDN